MALIVLWKRAFIKGVCLGVIQQWRTSAARIVPLLHERAILLVRNVPDSNEMWLHNFGKGQAVLDSKTEGLCRGVE